MSTSSATLNTTDIVAQIKQTAADNAVPIMQDSGMEFILNYIKQNKVRRVLEIGTGIGYSATKFALASPDVQVFTIEADIDRYHQAIKNFHDENLMDRVTCFLGDAATFSFEEKFDLIFIDGPKAQYIKFFERFKNNLAQGGAIISDNLSFHGMVEDISLTHNYSTKKLIKKIRKYIQFLKDNTEFKTEFYSAGDGIAVSKRLD
jgi:predicted O-methyltransferase YrrM